MSDVRSWKGKQVLKSLYLTDRQMSAFHLAQEVLFLLYFLSLFYKN